MTLAPPPLLSSPSAVRLRLVPQSVQLRMPRRIDGAWWPRSPDLASELPGLLGGLPHAWGQVTSVLVDEAAWSPFPSTAARRQPGGSPAPDDDPAFSVHHLPAGARPRPVGPAGGATRGLGRGGRAAHGEHGHRLEGRRGVGSHSPLTVAVGPAPGPRHSGCGSEGVVTGPRRTGLHVPGPARSPKPAAPPGRGVR